MMPRAACGLAALAVDHGAPARDLDSNWEVLGEAIQSVMRVHRLPEPYELLKELIRGRRIDAGALRAFIIGLGLSDDAHAGCSR